MDGIKDTGMMIDYAIEAADSGNPYASWFKSHAKMRLDNLHVDYDYISREIGLSEKARSGDAIADALLCHLEYQMSDLTQRYNSI